MHRKRVTSELHDSYFRLMTIKHSISKIQWVIMWALNYYLTQLSSGCQSSCQQTSRELETRYGRESHTPTEGALGKPPMELTPTSREQERHNVTVISSGGQNMKFMFGLHHPLTCKPWTTLSNPCNKVRGEYFSKEVFLRLPYCVFIMRPSFLRFPSCVFIVVSLWIILHIYVHICRCESTYVTI